MEKIKEEYKSLTEKLERNFKEKNETLDRNFVVKGDNFKKIHLEELNKMKADFAEGLKIMEQKNNNLHIK